MISALFVRRDTIYKDLGLDCWDIDRDARNWPGGNPLIAHPPCRAWASLRGQAKPREGERDLAILSVQWIRRWGGVLEHPRTSKLWEVANLPKPGRVDEYGGYTLLINQSWWGHKAVKKTFLYIVGCSERELPPIPISFDAIQYTVASKIKKKSGRRTKKEITKKEREETPRAFAEFLIEICKKIA